MPKITVKTLTGKKLADVDDLITITALKEQIQKDHNMPIETQKLVAKGKVLDEAEKTLKDYNLTEGSFIVVMKLQKKPEPSKKPVQNEEEVKQEEDPTKKTSNPQPAAQSSTQPATLSTGPSQPSAAQPTAAAINPQPVPAPTAPPVNEEQITTLIALSQKPRELCVQALQAAGGDPNLAYEFLTVGIPQMMPGMGGLGTDPMAQLAAQLQNMDQAGIQGDVQYGNEDGEYDDEHDHDGHDDPALDALQAFTDSPQFEVVRQRMIENPQFYNEFMQMLQQQQPQLYAIIQQNPMAFMSLIMGGNGDAQAEEDILEGHGDEDYNPDEEHDDDGEEEDDGTHEQVIDVTPTELEAIQRLVAITGFSQDRVAQAYFACGKNEEFAADFLFTGGAEDEDDAMNQAIAMSTGAGAQAQAQPVQPQPAAQSQPDVQMSNNDNQPAQQEQAQPPNPQPGQPSDQQQPPAQNPNQNQNQDGSGEGAGGAGGNEPA